MKKKQQQKNSKDAQTKETAIHFIGKLTREITFMKEIQFSIILTF